MADAAAADVAPAAAAADAPTLAFVYGTLAHPLILRRVLGVPADAALDIQAYPALAPQHAAHHVRGEDYPGLRPSALSSDGEPLPPAACFARGLVLDGLTPEHVRLLDAFEGDEYTRDVVEIILPDGPTPVPAAASPATAGAAVNEATEALLATFQLLDVAASALSMAPDSADDPELRRPAQIYLWTAGDDKLIPLMEGRAHRGAWRLEAFVQHKVQEWTSPSDESDMFKAVDRLRLGIPTAAAPRPALDDDDPWSSSAADIPAAVRVAAAAEAGVAADEDPWGTPRPYSPDPHGLTALVAAASVTSAPRSSSLDRVPLDVDASSRLGEQELEAHAGWGDGDAEPDEAQDEAGERFDDPDEDRRFLRLGHSIRLHWAFAEGYTNLNNGSFGAPPKEVRQLYRNIQEEADANPDLFHRSAFPKYLRTFYTRLAPHIHCAPENLCLVHNATTATNAVLRDFPWQRGDAIVTFNIVYGSVERTVRYLQDCLTPRLGDASQGDEGLVPRLVTVPIAFPMSHDAIVAKVEEVLDALPVGVQAKMMVVDAVTSKPAARMPWERICAILRKRGIFSLVDAAHGIGAIPINIAAAQPDVLITNPSKWCYAARAASVMYVSPEQASKVPFSSVPTGHGYMTLADLAAQSTGEKVRAWQAQWDDAGTTDFAHLPSAVGGLDFAETRLGGLARVQAYTTHLARVGGRAAARILGTETLDGGDADLAGIPMVNVRLPLDEGTWGEDWMAPGGVNEYFEAKLLWFKTTIPLCEHGGALYARFSAQVWLEKSDFEFGARALKEICRRLNAGEATPE